MELFTKVFQKIVFLKKITKLITQRFLYRLKEKDLSYSQVFTSISFTLEKKEQKSTLFSPKLIIPTVKAS